MEVDRRPRGCAGVGKRAGRLRAVQQDGLDDATADRRGRHDHAVELPGRHPFLQVLPGAARGNGSCSSRPSSACCVPRRSSHAVVTQASRDDLVQVVHGDGDPRPLSVPRSRRSRSASRVPCPPAGRRGRGDAARPPPRVARARRQEAIVVMPMPTSTSSSKARCSARSAPRASSAPRRSRLWARFATRSTTAVALPGWCINHEALTSRCSADRTCRMRRTARRRRRGRVGVVQDDHRVLAPSSSETSLGPAAIARPRRPAGGHRTREEGADAGVHRDAAPGSPPPWTTWSSAAGMPAHQRVDERIGAERRVLGRLEHDAVAGEQGREALPRRDGDREVPRRDHPDHPDGCRVVQAILSDSSDATRPPQRRAALTRHEGGRCRRPPARRPRPRPAPCPPRA